MQLVNTTRAGGRGGRVANPGVQPNIRPVTRISAEYLNPVLQLVNTTGAIFDLFGVKLYRITKERVYGLLTPELRAELEAEPNVKLPMNLMIQGLHDDQQLPLARSVADAGFLRPCGYENPLGWLDPTIRSEGPKHY